MATDILVDTNVLKHASNKSIPCQSACIELLEYILASNMLLCIEEGFSFIESENRSYMGLEYLTHLKPGMFGHHVVAYLLKNRRTKNVSKEVPAPILRIINRRIANRKDRTFLRIAFNTVSKILVTEDFEDFTVEKREYFYNTYKIYLPNAKRGLELIKV